MGGCQGTQLGMHLLPLLVNRVGVPHFHQSAAEFLLPRKEERGMRPGSQSTAGWATGLEA